MVKSISADSYLLTNLFKGLKKDIDFLSRSYDYVILFDIDKKLIDTVRVEKVSEKETKEFSALNLDAVSAQLVTVGISNYLSDKPTHYLCNEAYWYLLRKFNRREVLIHIPSIKNINEKLIDGLKQVFR